MAELRPTFHKNYERDFSFLEHVWGRSISHTIPEILGVQVPRPMYLQYLNRENMQFWENNDVLQSIFDALLERNTHGIEFIESIISRYKALLPEIIALQRKGVSATSGDMRQLLSLLHGIIPLHAIWFYSGSDERTPAAVKKAIMKVREKDDLAAENERFVRSWVSNQGRDWELVKFCTLEEFPAIPSDKVLEERRSKGFIAIDGREYFLGTIEEYAAAHPEFDFVKPQAEQAAEYVTGAIGYKGRVQGIVRLVKNTQMMDRVKDGDILVSPMTTPDFLLAMKKAAAFVTDEGGIMCHAAIVAREMKKPCVIGTKIATQVLKDGDLVEVDANAGVVRVIQKA